MRSLPARGGWRGRWSGRAGPIGVDFEADRAHFVQLEPRGGGFGLRDARSVRVATGREALLSSPEDLREMVREVLRAGRFQGRRVVTHAPPTDLRLMVLSYSLEDHRSEPEQILDLARERMRSDLVDHVVDYVPIRTSGDAQGERSALVAIAPEEPVIEHLERLRRAGLAVEALEIAPVSIRRLLAVLSPCSGRDVTLVVRLRPAQTQLTLLSGRRLLLYREIEIGLEAILAEVSKALDCDAEAARELLGSYGVGEPQDIDPEILGFPPETVGADGPGDIVSTLRETVRPALRGIVEQAHKAVSYAAFQTRGMSLDKVYLMDGVVSCPGLDGLLGEVLQLPVEPFDPLQALDVRRGRTPSSSDLRTTLALGMSLRGLADV